MGKKLVCYFSASGRTERLARRIADAASADLFEIEPKEPYTAADLDWRDSNSRTTLEMSDPASRPEVANAMGDIAEYETIFLGFPIWWYVAPTIVNTFLEQYDFAGKTIVSFATSGGSSMGNTVRRLQPSAPKAVFEPGRVLNSASEGDIKAFVTPYL